VCNRLALLTVVVLVLWPARSQADGQALPSRPTPLRLDMARPLPPDPGRGRLYPKAAELLQEARKLPARLALPLLQGPPAPPESPPPQQPAPAQAAPRSVFKGPVVEPEKMACTYFQAGQYDAAAQVYRKLLEEDPDDAHCCVMLLLCLRNMGQTEGVDELLRVLAADQQASPWLQWLSELDTLQPAAVAEVEE